jgi:hypothetical protein
MASSSSCAGLGELGMGKARALSTVFLAASLCHCGPRHEGGGTGGSSPSGGSGDGGGSDVAGASGSDAGGASSGNAGVPGSGNAGQGGASMAGSAGSNGGGSAGPSGPATEAVIGCEASTWPVAGYYFEAPPEGEFSTRPERLLARFTANGISGDGKLVVGHAHDLPYSRGLPLSWTTAGGLVELRSPPYETNAIQASCDGSVVLEQDVRPFQQVYRLEGDQEPRAVLGSSPPRPYIYMNPDATIIVNGNGVHLELYSVPLRWTAETGREEEIRALLDEYVYHVAPDGTLLGANATELFEYDPASDVKTPVGMSPVDLGGGYPNRFRASADGSAWVQAADLNFDSFLVWQPPAEPRSVTCPATCEVVDVSGTGQIALFDVALPSGGKSSWLWTLRDGLFDLTAAFEQHGFDFHGAKLRASAMSDDGRAFAGNVLQPDSPYPAGFFYAVLPAAVYAEAVGPECAADRDCEQSTFVCERAACVNGRCSAQLVEAGAPCDDGRFCTVDEACDGKGACTSGRSPCNELAPGIPRCLESEQVCEVCSDGRALVHGQCRCPYWNCQARGGATYCAQTDLTEENQVGCFYDGLTLSDYDEIPSDP